MLLPRQALASGILLTLFSSILLPSSVWFQIHGIAANATVLEHIAECTVEYRLVIQDHSTQVPLDCDAATSMQKSMGENKVKLDREDYVRLSYALPDGKPREAKVKGNDVLAFNTPVGATLPIVYDPKDPDHLRTPLITRPVLGIEMAMLLAGSYLLLRGFGVRPIGTVRAWIGGRSGQSLGGAKPGLSAAVARAELPPWTRQGRLMLLAGLLVVLATASAMTLNYAGELFRDLRLAHTWRTALDVRVEAPFCMSAWYVFTLCDATLVPSNEDNARPYRTQFLLSFSPEGGEFLVPVRSTADPRALATRQSADEKLSNRALTFGLAFVALLGIAISCIRRLASGRYRGGSAHLALLAANAGRVT